MAHRIRRTDQALNRFAPDGWQLVNADHIPSETISIRARQAANRFDLWRYQLHRAST
jgi:hypothetical protein